MALSPPCPFRQRKNSRSSPNARTSLPDDMSFTFSSGSCPQRTPKKNLKLQVGRLLGSGGFGSVFEGRCENDSRRVAIKKLHACAKNQHAIVEAFQAERDVIALTRHRNIVRILAVSAGASPVDSSVERLVLMEYAGERNLLQVINDPKERLSKFRRLKFATDINNALYFLHKTQTAHLDVKPANILVTNRDSCKLGDFGCSKKLSPNTHLCPTTPTTSSLTGTLAYRSPELLKGVTPTCSSDMYSYGVCLWQLLTRSRPYGSENLYVVIFGVVSYQLRPEVTKEMRALHPAYVRLFEDLWSAEPSQRPSSKQTMTRLRNMRKREKSRPPTICNERWRF